MTLLACYQDLNKNIYSIVILLICDFLGGTKFSYYLPTKKVISEVIKICGDYYHDALNDYKNKFIKEKFND